LFFQSVSISPKHPSNQLPDSKVSSPLQYCVIVEMQSFIHNTRNHVKLEFLLILLLTLILFTPEKSEMLKGNILVRF